MSFDMSTLNSKNAPMRWRAAADRLSGRPDELALLGEEYKELMQYVKVKNFNAGGTALPVASVSFVSKTATSATFDVSPAGLQWDGDFASKVWDGITAPGTPAAETKLTVTRTGKTTFALTATAGKHFVFSFDAGDSTSPEDSTAVTVGDIIYAPAAAAIEAVDGTNSKASVTFTGSEGTGSNVLYWKAAGTTVADVKTGTAIPGYVSGVVIDTGVGSVKFVLVSTNPGGSSDSNLGSVTVTQA